MARRGATVKATTESANGHRKLGTTPTLIVEPREVTAVGLECILQRNGIAVAGIARNGGEAISMASVTRPAVVLLGLSLPDMSPIRAGKQILRQSREVRVLALAHGSDEAAAGRVLLAGFHGQVSVDADGSEIAGTVRRAAVGEGITASAERSPDGWTLGAQLTDRELEVLGLLAIGLRNDQIAGRLYLSPHTVRTHVQNIRTKLRVRSRLEAVLLAIRCGLAEPGQARSA